MYSLVLSDDAVKFPTNGHELSKEAMEKLDDFSNRLKSENKNVYLEIQGHTDSTGSDDHNQQLSDRRAASVKAQFVAAGLPTANVRAVGKGETQPVASNDTPEGRAQNRRVVIIITPEDAN